MSLLNVVKCDACGKIHELGPSYSWLSHGSPDTWPAANLPDEWYCLVNGNPRTNESWNFCSAVCVAQHLKVSVPLPEVTQEQLPYKGRRFLLVDGDTADIRECVAWSGGNVAVEGIDLVYDNWYEFGQKNPGSGVQWIDKEVPA